jgi:peptidoglycan/LPS O-acetylase OafA/YrhL
MKQGAAAAAGELPGLNALRAIAAAFVVLGHIPMNQGAAGLPAPAWGAFFYRGQPAVLFFFTLSGFLITHLLLREAERTGEISIRRFYIRRMLRIWPLYFLVVALGLLVYKLLLPALGIPHEAAYSWSLALALYTLFLPNLMNALFNVGGILNPLWSIGIEEQFYLFWAPLVRRWRSRLPWVCAAVLGLFLALFVAQATGAFGMQRAKLFVGQLKFHFMAMGALAAWATHTHHERLLSAWPFRNRPAQVALLAVLVVFYFVGFGRAGQIAEELSQLVLYPWLVVNTSVNPRRVIAFDSALLSRLGVVSYGIYMLHMPAIYATSALFRVTTFWRGYPFGYLVAYYAIAIGSTLSAALLSYRFLEAPFLRLKQTKFQGVVVEPGAAVTPLPLSSSAAP